MERTQTKPTFDFSNVTPDVEDYIAAATLNAIKRFLKQPGGEKFLKAKIEELKARED